MMKKTKAALRAALALLCLAPVCLLPRSARADSVSYFRYSWDGSTLTRHTDTCPDAVKLVSGDTLQWGAAGSESWYAAEGTLTFQERVTVSGDVHLILTDGCSVKAEKGITVQGSDSLTIYAQSEGTGMGELEASGEGYDAGIGGLERNAGGDIDIHGGKVMGRGSNGGGAGIGGGWNGGGKVTICGGLVTGSNGDENDNGAGAGIGGGENASGTVVIYGGSVNATTYSGGAGIGGGWNGDGEVTIFEGNVTASTTRGRGACIGSGDEGNVGKVTISGGKVTVNAGFWGAGIGGGRKGTGEVTISGGTVTANASNDGAAIGGGYHGAGTVTISGGSVTASASNAGAAIGGGNEGTGGTIEISGGSVTASASGYGAAIGGGNEGTGGTIEISGGRVFAENTRRESRSIGNDGCIVFLGLSNADDYVYAKGYTGSVELTKALAAAGSQEVFNAGGVQNLDRIAGKILIPTQSNLYTLPRFTFTLPADLTEIGAEAFKGIAAEAVLVPAHVARVGANAFAGSNLEKIRFMGENTEVDPAAFSGCGVVAAFAPAGSDTLLSLEITDEDTVVPVAVPE